MTPDAPRPDLDEAERWLVSYVEQTAWHDDRTADAAAVVLAALAERDAEIARLRAPVYGERECGCVIQGPDLVLVCAEHHMEEVRATEDAIRALQEIAGHGCEYTTLCTADEDDNLCRSCVAAVAIDDPVASATLATAPAPAALHRGECYRACGCDDTAPAPAELRADCGQPDHEWTPCSDCPRSPNEPCACTGDPCCRRERDEQATAAAPAPAEDECGAGHDPERICCAHARDVERLRVDRELHQDRADRLAVELMRLRDQIGEVIAADRSFENGLALAVGCGRECSEGHTYVDPCELKDGWPTLESPTAPAPAEDEEE